MRVRAEDQFKDMTFGKSDANFYVDQPEAVAQIIDTRLMLMTGEFFLNTADGTPWMTKVFGRNTTSTYDSIIRQRILGTPNVISISDYSSTLDRGTRALSVGGQVNTAFGSAQVGTVVAPISTPNVGVWDQSSWDNVVWG